ncbi:hypothetical protein D3C85_1246270 [compost metagenome]
MRFGLQSLTHLKLPQAPYNRVLCSGYSDAPQGTNIRQLRLIARSAKEPQSYGLQEGAVSYHEGLIDRLQ